MVPLAVKDGGEGEDFFTESTQFSFQNQLNWFTEPTRLFYRTVDLVFFTEPTWFFTEPTQIIFRKVCFCTYLHMFICPYTPTHVSKFLSGKYTK